ncbi:MAG: hypothetical protein QXY49_00110 [Thermofilaceae archaeon]
MEKLEQLKKGIEISYYPLKSFFRATGEEWGRAALEAIGGLKYHLHLAQPAKAAKSYRCLFDLRTETIEYKPLYR